MAEREPVKPFDCLKEVIEDQRRADAMHPGPRCTGCGKLLPLTRVAHPADGLVIWLTNEAVFWLALLVVMAGSLLLASLAVAIAIIALAAVLLRLWFPRRCPYCGQWQRAKAMRRQKRGECVRCGYDLIGNVSGRCPECGQPCRTSAHDNGPPQERSDP